MICRQGHPHRHLGKIPDQLKMITDAERDKDRLAKINVHCAAGNRVFVVGKTLILDAADEAPLVRELVVGTGGYVIAHAPSRIVSAAGESVLGTAD